MIKKSIGFFLLSLLLCGTIFMIVACSENDCSITRRPAARFTFYETGTDQAIVYPYDTLTVTAVREPELEDSILLNRIRAVQYISLPLRYKNAGITDNSEDITQAETVYILRYNIGQLNPMVDTIWITHTNIPTFISMDCGRDMFFHIDSIRYTTYVLDTILIIDRDIRDHEKENFQIYYTVEL